MRFSTCIILPIVALALPACSGAMSSVDPDLDCAANISASTYLHVGGQIDLGDDNYRKALFSLGVYTAKYAIPNNLSEAQVTAEIKALREQLVASQRPKKVKNRAVSCIRKTPNV